MTKEFKLSRFNEFNQTPGETLTWLSEYIHQSNIAAGWWTDSEMIEWGMNSPMTGEESILKYVIPTKLALVHSEVSEALEGYRKGLMDDKLPERPMIEVELADAIIRILDIAGALELDIGGALVEKFNYNQTRADHKPENRAAEGGKKI